MPHVIFFISSASIMVVELVAGRLVASHLGSSLYTWSAVIAVMLAGITVGNVAGGRLADRYEAARIVLWLSLAAAAACMVALGLNALFTALRPFHGLAWPVRIIVSVLIIFIAPATLLGTLSPSLAKMAVARGRRLGSTLGSFYAAGLVGSITGTFLTGFWLLFALGNTRVVVAAAIALCLAGLLSRLPRSVHPTNDQRPQTNDQRPTTNNQRPTTNDYTPHLIVFLTSTCLMVVEMLASRIIAEQVGSSLYTWTSVIGVVFAGMSIGNLAGGRLADRFDPARFLGWLFMAASIAATSILVVTYVLETREPFASWHWPAIVFSTVLCSFFLPSLLLGAFGPVAMKRAVVRSTTVGTTIGRVSAWNAAGSIVGTLAAGFWLIPALGPRSLTMVIASVLAASGLGFGPWRLLHAVWCAAALALLTLTTADAHVLAKWRYADAFRESQAYAFSADSAYQYVRVYDDTSDDEPERALRVLSLDHLIHGYVDLQDPTFLNYDYERIYRDVLRRYARSTRRVSAFFVGGGSFTFPRWLLAEWPSSKVVVAEIDPLVLEANHRALGLRRDTPIRTMLMDARNAVDDLAPGDRFDFFLGDAFNDLAIPYHLTTLEFTQKVARHLTPNGAYLVNIIDNYDSGLLLGSFVQTLRRVFRHVYVFCTEQDGPAPRRDTFVVAASNVPLHTEGLEQNHEGDFEGSLLTAENMAALEMKCRRRVLTDDDAPVENLIAPVVRERTGKDR